MTHQIIDTRQVEYECECPRTIQRPPHEDGKIGYICSSCHSAFHRKG